MSIYASVGCVCVCKSCFECVVSLHTAVGDSQIPNQFLRSRPRTWRTACLHACHVSFISWKSAEEAAAPSRCTVDTPTELFTQPRKISIRRAFCLLRLCFGSEQYSSKNSFLFPGLPSTAPAPTCLLRSPFIGTFNPATVTLWSELLSTVHERQTTQTHV